MELGDDLWHQFRTVAIGRLERFVADWDRAEGSVQLPEMAPANGKRNAIVGSGLILMFSMLISTPVGILAGIYLAEYGRDL